MNNNVNPLALAMFQSKYQPVALAHQKELKRLTITELLEQFESIQRNKGKSEKRYENFGSVPNYFKS